MPEAPDFVITVESLTIHVRRVRFGSHRRRLRQREGAAVEMAVASSGHPLDLLPGGLEHVIGEDGTLHDTVTRIRTDTALTSPGP
ncbi:hypothetical protein ACIRPK_07275 [Kitasatospora sp. NPDC101801]|uniref:hypothetical protein n=1 Tax=Kitasatospora sp. NPDC101801 TaxID=3364103 RepID=UPI003823F2AD